MSDSAPSTSQTATVLCFSFCCTKPARAASSASAIPSRSALRFFVRSFLSSSRFRDATASLRSAASALVQGSMPEQREASPVRCWIMRLLLRFQNTLSQALHFQPVRFTSTPALCTVSAISVVFFHI